MADPFPDEELLAFLRDVLAGRRRFRTPDADFDPLTLSPKESVMLGLPPPPHPADPAAKPWYAIAKSRLREGPRPGSELMTDAPRTGYNRLGLKGHMETSRNWSGAVISSPYRERPFGLLIGSWQVPDFRKPAGKSETEYACSTWIGFDGHRRISRSLPQIGTVQRVTCDTSGACTSSIKAWVQWWWDDTDGPIEYEPEDFPIDVGHEMIASLFVIPGIGVLMNMLNADTGQPIDPVLYPPPDVTLEPKALDAECVLERPKSQQWPFPNFVVPEFEPTTFRCHAFLRGETTSRTMRGGRLIRMVHLGSNTQIGTIATPDAVADRAAVTVTYVGR